MVDVLGKYEQLAKSDENRKFAEFRASVQAMK